MIPGFRFMYSLHSISCEHRDLEPGTADAASRSEAVTVAVGFNRLKPTVDGRTDVLRRGYAFSAPVVFVAQTPSLLYRRMPSCRTAPWPGQSEHCKRPADLQSAIQQITNLRYAKRIPSRSDG